MNRTVPTLAAAGAVLAGGLVLTGSASAAGPLTHTTTLDGDRAVVTVDGAPEFAGKDLSVLVLGQDADPFAPTAADIVYANQLVLDDAGNATFRVVVPEADLGSYVLALNTSAQTERYVAVLDGSEIIEDRPGNAPTHSGKTGQPDHAGETGRPGHAGRP